MRTSIRDWLLQRDRWQKRFITFSIDLFCCVLAVWCAFTLRLGVLQAWNTELAIFLFASLISFPPIFFATGVYRNMSRFTAGGAIIQLAVACSILLIPLVIVFSLIAVPGIPRTLPAIFPVVFFVMAASTRALARYALVELLDTNRGGRRRTLIYGAGARGQQLASSIKLDPDFKLIGFTDDDSRLHGQRLDGVPIHRSDNLEDIIRKKRIAEVFLAIPRVGSARHRQIIERLRELNVHVMTLPSTLEMVEGRVSINDTRELKVEDLLGRDPVKPNDILLGRTIVEKTVLVTGAGGSIGGELCRQIVTLRPSTLVIADMSEFGLYRLENELRASLEGLAAPPTIVPKLVNVADAAAVERLFAETKPDTVFHAAAYKHVPLVESNIVSGLTNNVLSTWNTMNSGLAHGTQHYILISSDKAVRPTNIMGASKRLCELLLQACAAQGPETCFSMVRFGNVLGSSGSVVPYFEKQIREGGPVTLTHRDITRYFMTIPEAAQLVIQAGGMARGGEVFLLDMGEPVRIYDLATTMIELSGHQVKDAEHPGGDIEIVEVGLRPGEKLYEELLIGEEAKQTSHPRILMAHENFLAMDELEPQLEALLALEDDKAAIALVARIVPDFDHQRDNPTQQRQA